MSAPLICSALAAAVLAQAPPEKPRNRDAGETRDANVARYPIGGFDQGTGGTLGMTTIYPAGVPQGVTVVSFDVESPARDGGIRTGDQILEVNGSPVGLIRGRHYDPRHFYARAGDATSEVLVSYVDDGGRRRAYYLPVRPEPADGSSEPGEYRVRPSDYYRVPKPSSRDEAEAWETNVSRYRPSAGTFDRYAMHELGVQVSYSADRGATIVAIKPGGAAERAGLEVGDAILEVDGAPIGLIDGRLYEGWRQFEYADDGTVELLVGFSGRNPLRVRYYYPLVTLDPRTAPN